MVKVIVGVEGMMCAMCENHMNDAVKNTFKVKKVVSSHTEKKTVFVTSDSVSEEQMGKVVSEVGYKMTSFKTEPYEKKGLFSFGKK